MKIVIKIPKSEQPKTWVRTPINQKSGPHTIYKVKKPKHKKREEEEYDS